MIFIDNTKPQGISQRTGGSVGTSAGGTVTYNQANYTYNEAGGVYGGAGASSLSYQDVISSPMIITNTKP